MEPLIKNLDQRGQGRLEANPESKVSALSLLAIAHAGGSLHAPIAAIGGKSIRIPSWHELDGAFVWVVNFFRKSDVQAIFTAEVAAGKWRFAVEEAPPGRSSTVSLEGMKLEPVEPLEPDSDVTEELTGKWVHATVEIGGRTLHCYGQVYEGAIWSIPPFFKAGQGAHPYRIATQIFGESVAIDGTPTSSVTADVVAKSRAKIEEPRARIDRCRREFAKADASDRPGLEKMMADSLAWIAQNHLWLGESKEAGKTATQALATANQGSCPRC